jgi:hypothetical protein
MDSTDLLRSADKDARALLVAAQTRWDRPVPHCPEWDAAGLVSHVGTVLAWQAAIVTTGERVNLRTLEPAPPENPESLPAWYLAALERVLQVLGSADPEATTWTFSSVGDRRASWWRRRLAVEVATHRWDAEHAVADDDQGGAGPQSIDGEVASAGIGEFAAEFLPRLMAQEDLEGITGTLHLAALDGPGEWRIDLDNGRRTTSEPADAGAGAGAEAGTEADTTIRGTRSDLLLWLQNRGQLDTLEVSGDRSILDRWGQLSF